MEEAAFPGSVSGQGGHPGGHSYQVFAPDVQFVSRRAGAFGQPRHQQFYVDRGLLSELSRRFGDGGFGVVRFLDHSLPGFGLFPLFARRRFGLPLRQIGLVQGGGDPGRGLRPLFLEDFNDVGGRLGCEGFPPGSSGLPELFPDMGYDFARMPGYGAPGRLGPPGSV